MLPRNIFRLSVYFAVAAYLSSANADPTQESIRGVRVLGVFGFTAAFLFPYDRLDFCRSSA
jgi:hypothetical protein